MRLCPSGEVVLAWTDDPQDPQWELSHACLELLEKERDAKGRKLKVHKLPIPQKPVCICRRARLVLSLKRERTCGRPENVWLPAM